MSDKSYPTHKEIAPEHQEMMKKIGDKIKELRKAESKTYMQMAKLVGISRNSYNLMELGRIYFKFSTLLRILDYYKISVKDFFNDI